MNFLEPQDWTFPVPIAYGPGRLGDITRFCRSASMSHPLIVTDRKSLDLPFISKLTAHLKAGGVSHSVFSGISPNPRDDEVVAGCQQFRSGAHDGVIAIGGGSGMDGGKSIALLANNEIELWAFEYEQVPPSIPRRNAFPPLICIPTTAGTGAETESTAMVTDTERMMKWCVWHPELKPATAILDPELTLDLPPHLTAWTGVDALVHAIEAYCVPGFHPLCDGVALEAMRLVGKWLPVAVNEPDNLNARGAMLAGSCLAGVAFLKGLGLVHAVSHMVGAEYDTHHGLTNAVLLPVVLRYNAPAIGDKISPMCHALNLDNSTFEALDNKICSLLDAIAIPVRLSDIGVAADCASTIAAKALQDSAASTNPRSSTIEDLEALIEAALTKAR